MSDVSVVVAGGASRFGEVLGASLAVPFLPLDAAVLAVSGQRLVAARRLVWIHAVPALATTAQGEADGSLTEAELLQRSAGAAREVADRSNASLVFVAVLPSRGLVTGHCGAACTMAAAAMTSLMQFEIGPWSNAGHRLLSVVYSGLAGHVLDAARSEDEVRNRTPMHELCTFRQLADAIRYVGSERAAYLTGISLHVDGGWNAYSWMYPARTI